MGFEYGIAAGDKTGNGIITRLFGQQDEGVSYSLFFCKIRKIVLDKQGADGYNKRVLFELPA